MVRANRVNLILRKARASLGGWVGGGGGDGGGGGGGWWWWWWWWWWWGWVLKRMQVPRQFSVLATWMEKVHFALLGKWRFPCLSRNSWFLMFRTSQLARHGFRPSTDCSG